MDELFKDMELKGLAKFSVIALNNLRKIYDNTLNIEQVQLDDLETALPKDFELSGETNTNYLKNICKERIN